MELDRFLLLVGQMKACGVSEGPVLSVGKESWIWVPMDL